MKVYVLRVETTYQTGERIGFIRGVFKSFNCAVISACEYAQSQYCSYIPICCEDYFGASLWWFNDEINWSIVAYIDPMELLS